MRIKEIFNNVSEYLNLWRRLTEGEVRFAQGVFGNNIDYDQVKLFKRRIWPNFAQDENRAVAFNNRISFPNLAYSDDFAREPAAVKQSVFIHELHHVWQHQNKALSHFSSFIKENLKHHFNYQNAYYYVLKPGADLLEYGFEQQAAIVQDYFLLKFNGITESYKNRRFNDETNPEKLLGLYEGVLKNFLNTPSPDYVRAVKHGKDHAPALIPPARP